MRFIILIIIAILIWAFYNMSIDVKFNNMVFKKSEKTWESKSKNIPQIQIERSKDSINMKIKKK